VIPAVASSAPGRSRVLPGFGVVSGSSRGVRARAASATPRGTAKVQRQDSSAEMTPESRLPAVAPSTESPPQVAIALPYAGGEGKTARSTATAAGAPRAGPEPCAKGAAGSVPVPGAGGEAAEAAAKRTRPAVRARRAP